MKWHVAHALERGVIAIFFMIFCTDAVKLQTVLGKSSGPDCVLVFKMTIKYLFEGMKSHPSCAKKSL